MYRKIIKAVSVILSVTMLMGITVFADTITDLQNQKNQKEKEKGQKPGCHKPSPLKKSRPRDLVAQGTNMT